MAGTEPVLGKASFTCPHCGALAHQGWWMLAAHSYGKDIPAPHMPDQGDLARISTAHGLSSEEIAYEHAWIRRMWSGLPFLGEEKEVKDVVCKVDNVWLSRCFSCDQMAVWVGSHLVFPIWKLEVLPNEDLPDNIKVDFTEAARILDLSPRGSAALLRLCVQKLCIHLGQPGHNLNSDIGELVKNGLNVRVQKALDIVRVIGNNAVHPGEMETTDNRDVALKLFDLVNLITDAMITQPKRIDALYDSLPNGAIRQIERRDGNKD